ncbi:hypothetical protein P691DRAFT_729110 [Macrolepiota fuliginosa MF-IS2]|uniref:DUF6534 domain-containing protein n=1 Tax=Macrolepiota fuliginosa MF-IS2 TaxID=1400762 RepID=A0A9P5XGH4_9AGAR|nr:hypothetical protein P691DRAFT_729110 [Macrolepiota fuliginosa MF-IS2]
MPSTELLLGPMLIGVFANTILYGILIVQSFIYYQAYKRDPTWIRYFVLYLFLLETLNTGFDIGMMYEPLVKRFGTERAVTIAPIMLDADPIVTVMISTPVQLFMAWRIQAINKSVLITSSIVFFAICALVGGIATTVSVTLIPEFARLQRFHGAVITWLASSAAGDVVITASLVWSLYRRKTGFKSTDDQISRIMRLTIQTGAITAVSAAADVLIFVLVPKTTLNFIWDFALSKLYTNSLLSTLNARAGWNNLAGNPNDTHNVLFGDQERISGSQRQVTINGKLSHQLHPNRQISSTGVYELDTYISSNYDSEAKSPVTSNIDLERGISVTKVVETMVEDPLPEQPGQNRQRKSHPVPTEANQSS